MSICSVEGYHTQSIICIYEIKGEYYRTSLIFIFSSESYYISFILPAWFGIDVLVSV